MLTAAHARYQDSVRFTPGKHNFTEELCYYGQVLLNAVNNALASAPKPAASGKEHEQSPNKQQASAAPQPAAGAPSEDAVKAQPGSLDWAAAYEGLVQLVLGVAGAKAPSLAALVAALRLHLQSLQLVARHGGALSPASVGRLLAPNSSFVRLRCAPVSLQLHLIC